MAVFGTAGHVDHGKTALLKTLTGIDPDRLKEEKERGMTTDLGFAWLTLPSGKELAFIDVPGHEKFLKNMLAGIGSIQGVLFIIAANEGWMPQTEEHFNIVNLLGIKSGVVALTKVDLVDKQKIENEIKKIHEKLKASSINKAAIIPVSVINKTGIKELVNALDKIVMELPPISDVTRPRLFIDRIFSIKGAGTVVAGTLTGGKLKLNESLVIMPYGKEVRIRAIQMHKHSANEALPGNRVALNLANIEVGEIKRGDTLVLANQYRLTDRIYVDLVLLSGITIKQNQRVHIYVGSFETEAFIKKVIISAQKNTFIELKLAHSVILEKGDRFILRDPSKNITIGGGTVMAPFVKESLRKSKNLESLLITRAKASPEELIKVLLKEEKVISKAGLINEIPLGNEHIVRSILELKTNGTLTELKSFIIEKQHFDEISKTLTQLVSAYHKNHPLEYGIQADEVRRKANLSKEFFAEFIEYLTATNALAFKDGMLKLPSFTISIESKENLSEKEKILNLLKQNSFSPPTIKEFIETYHCDSAVLNALVKTGELIKVSDELVFAKETISRIKSELITQAQKKEKIEIADFKSLFNITRKYAIPLLEYFDIIGVTKRIGNYRVLK